MTADILDTLPTDQIRLGRNWVRRGDPVRWRNHHGLFRFAGVDRQATDDSPAVLHLFGPYKKTNSKPLSRYVHADQVVRVMPTEELRMFVRG